MGKKRDKIVNEINRVVNDISCKTGVDSLKILEELLRDLDLEKKDKKYPDINLNTVSIEGGIDKIKTILESCIERVKADKEEEERRVRESEYYKEVKKYTHNFENLIGDVMITWGMYGHYEFKKTEYRKKFIGLKKRLIDSKPENQEEEEFLRSILEGKSDSVLLDTSESAIIEDRIKFIESEREKENEAKDEKKRLNSYDQTK